AGRGRRGAGPTGQTRTATSAHSSRTVPGRSGSASAASNPAASIARTPSARRLVPLTSRPLARSRSPNSRPRQPQPTISALATLGYFFEARVLALDLVGAFEVRDFEGLAVFRFAGFRARGFAGGGASSISSSRPAP